DRGYAWVGFTARRAHLDVLQPTHHSMAATERSPVRRTNLPPGAVAFTSVGAERETSALKQQTMERIELIAAPYHGQEAHRSFLSSPRIWFCSLPSRHYRGEEEEEDGSRSRCSLPAALSVSCDLLMLALWLLSPLCRGHGDVRPQGAGDRWHPKGPHLRLHPLSPQHSRGPSPISLSLFLSRTLTFSSIYALIDAKNLQPSVAVLQMWPDLVEKSKNGGLDIVETYVFWNLHEPVQGQVIATESS
ncbi:hypothetical protein GW17_00037946, partial [Ensete ventricosum]